MRATILLLSLLFAGAAGHAPRAQGKVFLTVDEALELAFPEAVVTRETLVLGEDEQAEVAQLAGLEFSRRLVFRYVARRKPDTEGGAPGPVIGTAWFDTHRVRTLRETTMVVVDPTGRITRTELLAFGEPTDYVPRDSWYAQLHGRSLDAELQVGRAIRGVTGATLTARATVGCARRVLALHQVVTARDAEPEPVPEPAPSPPPTPEGGGK